MAAAVGEETRKIVSVGRAHYAPAWSLSVTIDHDMPKARAFLKGRGYRYDAFKRVWRFGSDRGQSREQVIDELRTLFAHGYALGVAEVRNAQNLLSLLAWTEDAPVAVWSPVEPHRWAWVRSMPIRAEALED